MARSSRPRVRRVRNAERAAAPARPRTPGGRQEILWRAPCGRPGRGGAAPAPGAAGLGGTARRAGRARRDVHPRRARTAPAARHTPYSRNEIVVTYGLIGMLDPSDSRIPPTTDTVAKAALSTGTSTGDAVTRTAAAA